MVLTVVAWSCRRIRRVRVSFLFIVFVLDRSPKPSCFQSWAYRCLQEKEEKKDAKMEEKNGEKSEEKKDEKTEKEQPEEKEDKDKEEEEDYDDNSFDDNMSVPSEESIQEESDLGGGTPSHDDSV